MHVLALRLALSHLKTKLFSRVLVVASVACVLLINALVFLLFQSFSQSLTEVRASRFITAYLETAVQPSHENEVLSAVRKLPGVSSAQLVSRDAFIDNFSKYFPQLSNELATLDVDAVPRYVKVKVNGDQENQVKDRLSQLKGIEQVELNKNRFSGLIGALATLRRLALALMGGMSIALLCILLNHFKLESAFRNQVRATFGVLGARTSQVLLPFAIEGLIEGAAGGLIAAAMLLAYGRFFESQMNDFFSAIGYHPYHFELGVLALVLAFIGTLSGMIGSTWAAIRITR